MKEIVKDLLRDQGQPFTENTNLPELRMGEFQGEMSLPPLRRQDAEPPEVLLNDYGQMITEKKKP